MRYEEKMMQPFYKIGKWIASKMVKKEDVKYQKLEQTLQFVENSAKEKDAFEFTARRIAKVMMTLFWGTGLCFLAAVFTGEAKEITFLARPSYGQGSMETDLEVQVEGEGEAQKIPILLQERQYSDQQIDEFFQQAIEDLESVILGENISMQEVRSSLEFPSSVLDGKVKADWFTDDMGLIDEKGNLVGEAAEGGTQVQITVNFSCQDREMDYHFSVCVFSPVRSEEEKQQKQNQLQPFLHGRADVEHSRHGVIAHQLRQKAADGACEKRDQHAAKNSRQQSPRLSFQQEYSQQRPADAGQQQIRPHDEPLPPCRPTLRRRQNKPSSTVEIRNRPLPASKRTRSHKKPL